MSSIALHNDPIDKIELVPAETPDRLPAMLFLAALIHGILIIGITFNSALLDGWSEAISLEVTIVADPDQRIDRPDKAEYLAQASQMGGGNTREEVRPSAPLESLSPIDNPGEENAESLVDARNHEKAADQLITTQNDRDRQVANDLRDQPQPQNSMAVALESGAEQTLPLPQDERATMRIHDDDPRQLIVSADTRESKIAPYLDNWKRRIDAVGDDYLREIGGLGDFAGSPTLEVNIHASGQLAEVVIRQSSGSRIIDRAALDILRRAAPFDPFPNDMKADYDHVRFAYKWLFSERPLPATASLR